MVSIEDIPAEKRWEIAAKSASAMPLLYDMHFRKVLGEKYDDIERPIWIEGGREAKNLAMALGLPSGNAREISETIGVVGAILYGPEFRFERAEKTREGIAGRITGCPVLNRAREMGLDPEIVAHSVCQAFEKSAVENLNPEYSLRFNESMCSGDKYCEIVIERRK